MSEARARVILATGGTGGHIYPALAVAGQLLKAGVSVAVLGQTGGLEQRLTAEAGVPFHGVPSGKLDRQRPDPRQLYRALQGVVRARGVLKRLRPELVIGFGGFASLPGVAAAASRRVPLWLNEQNAFPGLVTRLFAGRAEKVIISVAQAAARINSRDLTHIPYPVDESRTPKAEARRLLGLPEQGVLTLVMGGSQGSVAINGAVVSVLRAAGSDSPATLHVTGPANLERVTAATVGLDRYWPQGYVDGTLAFAAADLAISRAGTGTLSMAAFHGVPLIMVPLPTSAENHQYHNAAAVSQAGAGILLEQDRLDALADSWLELLEPARRSAAADSMAGLSPEGALEAFTTEVLTRLETGAA